MKEIQDLEFLAEEMLSISNCMSDRETSWRGKQASLVFARIASTAFTLLKNVPESSYFKPAGKHELWDLPAAVSICRTQIEAYYVLCYLRHEPSDENERRFQYLLWEYHEEYERYQMLINTLPKSDKILAIEAELKSRRERLEASPIFQGLSNDLKRELRDGKKFKLKSAIQLSQLAGISEGLYAGQYKYCSAYTHCAPFSVSQLSPFQAGSAEAIELFAFPVRMTLGYSALGIRDFAVIFPEAERLIKDRTRAIILLWSEIMRKWGTY